jgi:hypothetical protein
VEGCNEGTLVGAAMGETALGAAVSSNEGTLVGAAMGAAVLNREKANTLRSRGP